jgi:predicted transcriptional regulator
LEEYWEFLIQRLTLEDAIILTILNDHDITTSVRSMSTSDLMEKSNLTEAIYRKCIIKLTSLRFIEINTGKKQYAYFLTEFGLNALESFVHFNNKGVALA